MPTSGATEVRKVAAPGARRGRAHRRRHQGRRAGRQGPPVGLAQALQAGAAGGLLPRRAGDRAAQGHAQDLRADRTPFRLGAGCRSRRARPRSRATGWSGRCSAQGIVSLDSICTGRGQGEAGGQGAHRARGQAPSGWCR